MLFTSPANCGARRQKYPLLCKLAFYKIRRMVQLAGRQTASIKKRAGIYNMIPNLIWSILHLTPLTVFCFRGMAPLWVYLSLALSFLLGLLPTPFLRYLQLGKTTRIYKKIGIGIIRKYSQDGDLINSLLRKRFPGYRVIDSKGQLGRYISRTYLFERFHFMVLLFMLITAVYASARGHGWWALLITFNNILYNLYPIFLQQYNRLRLAQILGRMPSTIP